MPSPVLCAARTDLPALASRTFITGSTGTGKSTLARALVEGAAYPKILVIDPTMDWTREARGHPLGTMQDVASWLGRRRGARLAIYRPPDGRYREAAEAVAKMAFQAQEPFIANNGGDRLLIVLDEASGALPSRGSLLPAVKGLIERGRHYGIDLVAITQRPSQVHADMRSNSALRIYLPVFDAGDLQTVRREIGRDADRLPQLPPFTALVQANGTVSELKVPRPKSL